MNRLKNVKIYWTDAVIYSASSVAKKLEIEPDKKVTEGTIEKKGDWGVVIKNPHTINIKTGKRDHREEKEKKATFLFIPSGMINKVE